MTQHRVGTQEEWRLPLHVRPGYEAGCPVCSSIADNLDANVPHLRARDVTMICSSRAALDKLHGYRQRMGWSFDWVSTVGRTSTAISASCTGRTS